eukprot:GILJ01012684.1.p1 GENE.GILJ01012684.1~~GILJ01012684.1.p1  ORF type:complete len:1110 (-),score=164.97 GILJ01012684.1:43-3045(-)
MTVSLEHVKRISDLHHLPNLRYLSLNMNEISKLEGLDGNQFLEELSVCDNQIQKVENLECLTQLHTLLLKVNAINDISGVQCLTSLRVLELNNNSISDVSPLRGCQRLQKLSLFRNKVIDVESLSSLSSLQYLDLGRNQVSDLTPLARCKYLQSLILYENQICSLPPVFPHLLLRELWLNGNRITSVTSLGFLPLLEHLHLNDNRIRQISPLHSCQQLRTLNLSFNELDDLNQVSSLKPCQKLQHLQLNDNLLADNPNYKSMILSTLPHLHELDNQPVTLADRLVGQTAALRDNGYAMCQTVEYLLARGLHVIQPVSSADSIIKSLHDVYQTYGHQWRSSLLSDSHAKKVQAEEWTQNTFQMMCALQNQERTQLLTQHRRREDTEKRNARQKGTVDSHYDSEVRKRELDELKEMTERQFKEQINFVPANYQNKFIKDLSYEKRRLEYMMNRSAIRLQSQWRAGQARLEVKLKRWSRFVPKIRSIQAVIRGYLVRKTLVGGKKYQAAVRIQSVWKGYRLRQRLRNALNRLKDDDDDDDMPGVDLNDFNYDANANKGFTFTVPDAIVEQFFARKANPSQDIVAGDLVARNNHVPSAWEPVAKPSLRQPHTGGMQASEPRISVVFDAPSTSSARTISAQQFQQQQQQQSKHHPQQVMEEQGSETMSVTDEVNHEEKSLSRQEREELRLMKEWGFSSVQAVQAMLAKKKKMQKLHKGTKEKHLDPHKRLERLQRALTKAPVLSSVHKHHESRVELSLAHHIADVELKSDLAASEGRRDRDRDYHMVSMEQRHSTSVSSLDSAASAAAVLQAPRRPKMPMAPPEPVTSSRVSAAPARDAKAVLAQLGITPAGTTQSRGFVPPALVRPPMAPQAPAMSKSPVPPGPSIKSTVAPRRPTTPSDRTDVWGSLTTTHLTQEFISSDPNSKLMRQKQKEKTSSSSKLVGSGASMLNNFMREPGSVPHHGAVDTPRSAVSADSLPPIPSTLVRKGSGGKPVPQNTLRHSSR